MTIENTHAKECRRFARQVWREEPYLSVEEMLDRNEIKWVACQGINYDRDQLLNWILPDATPHEELPFFKGLTVWSLDEAVALWLDFNPFILVQAIQKYRPQFWNQAFHPNLRENFHLLREKASRSALAGELKAAQKGDQFFVTPRDFYEWAIKNTDGPNGSRPENFFAELQKDWSINAINPNKPPGKVDEKKKEIDRILGVIKAVDPEFNSANMPGRKEDFQKLCIQLNKQMFSIAPSTFNDYLPKLCMFKSGARKTDYYTKIADKLGGN